MKDREKLRSLCIARNLLLILAVILVVSIFVTGWKWLRNSGEAQETLPQEASDNTLPDDAASAPESQDPSEEPTEQTGMWDEMPGQTEEETIGQTGTETTEGTEGMTQPAEETAPSKTHVETIVTLLKRFLKEQTPDSLLKEMADAADSICAKENWQRNAAKDADTWFVSLSKQEKETVLANWGALCQVWETLNTEDPKIQELYSFLTGFFARAE